MRFVIVGYGRVGTRTAHILQEEGHDVVVVESNHDKAERARGRGIEVVEGDGGNEEVLRRAALESADAVGGLTGDPNVNYLVCLLGKQFGCRTVMRISEDYRTDIYERYADDVDEVVYPERLGAAGAKTALLGGDFNALGDLTERLQLIAVTIPESAQIVGQRVAELDLPNHARVYAHGRGRRPMTIPLPGTQIEAGDRLALVVETESRRTVETALVGE